MAKVFDKDSVQQADVQAALKPYSKKTVTMIARVDGPFTVKTREGEVTCPDGYLAIDSKGWPYPVASDEFDNIYEPAEEPAHDDTQPEDDQMNAQELQIRRKAASLELEAYEKLAEAQRLLESCGQPNAAMMAGGPSVGPASVVSPEASLPVAGAPPQGEQAVTLVMAASEKIASLEILNRVASELHLSSDPEMKKLSAEVDKIASELDKVAFVYESDTVDPELELHSAFKGGLVEGDSDEKSYMNSFKTDKSHEVASAVKDKRVYAPVAL